MKQNYSLLEQHLDMTASGAYEKVNFIRNVKFETPANALVLTDQSLADSLKGSINIDDQSPLSSPCLALINFSLSSPKAYFATSYE